MQKNNKPEVGHFINGFRLVLLLGRCSGTLGGQKRTFVLAQCPHCDFVGSFVLNKIKSGHTKSCGCVRTKLTYQSKNLDLRTKLNKRFYRIWSDMKSRCDNPKQTSYHHYGGRGIKYCKKWIDFCNFQEEMSEGYRENLTLDRIDPNGDYTRENCRWTDRSTQSYNRRKGCNNSSGKVGVNFEKHVRKWKASITVNKVYHFLGFFEDLGDAIKARRAAEFKYYGYLKEQYEKTNNSN